MLKKFIVTEGLLINPAISSRDELFASFAKKAFKKGLITNEEAFVEGLIKREEQGSTELKPGIAIPHVKSEIVNEIFVMIAVVKDGVKFSPGFGKGAKIVFLIGAPKMENKYINVLGAIARLIDKEAFTKELLKANVADDIIFAIKNFSFKPREIKENKKSYLIHLSLNIDFSIKPILAMFLELGIHQPVLFDGENLTNKSHFGLSFFGLSAVDVKRPLTENTTIQGITDEKEACTKLYGLLKEEGIDLDLPGIGSLAAIELSQTFGGYDPEVNF